MRFRWVPTDDEGWRSSLLWRGFYLETVPALVIVTYCTSWVKLVYDAIRTYLPYCCCVINLQSMSGILLYRTFKRCLITMTVLAFLRSKSDDLLFQWITYENIAWGKYRWITGNTELSCIHVSYHKDNINIMDFTQEPPPLQTKNLQIRIKYY